MRFLKYQKRLLGFGQAGVCLCGIELTVIEVGVEPVLGEQILMLSLLNDVTVFHDQDDVGIANGGQSVCHDKACATVHHAGKRILDFQLGARINGGGSLIQNEHWRQTQHHAGDAKQLLLSLGQTSPALVYDGVVSLRQATDKAVRMRGSRSRDHLFIGRIRFSYGDVVADGS